MRSSLGAVALALCLSGGSSTLSCSPCSVHGQNTMEYTGGITNGSRTIYQSSTVEGEMLHFPQGRRYDLVHGLGSKPLTVDIFVSFREALDPDGNPDDDTQPNNLSPSAGNQAVIERWDDEVVRIRNDTCATFYVRVIAIADPDLSGLGAAGATSE